MKFKKREVNSTQKTKQEDYNYHDEMA